MLNKLHIAHGYFSQQYERYMHPDTEHKTNPYANANEGCEETYVLMNDRLFMFVNHVVTFEIQLKHDASAFDWMPG